MERRERATDRAGCVPGQVAARSHRQCRVRDTDGAVPHALAAIRSSSHGDGCGVISVLRVRLAGLGVDTPDMGIAVVEKYGARTAVAIAITNAGRERAG